MTELEPCPFCGSKEVKARRGQIVGNRPDSGIRFVHCDNCSSSGPFELEKHAVAAWNRVSREVHHKQSSSD